MVGGRHQVGGYSVDNFETISKTVLPNGGSMAAESGRDWDLSEAGVAETLEVVESIAYEWVVVDTVVVVMVVPP